MEHAPTPQRHRPMPPGRSPRPCRDWSRPRTRPPGRARRRRKAARTRPARLVARLGAVGRTARSRDSPWHPASGRAARSRKRYWSRTSQSETRRRCCTSEHPKGKAAPNEVGGPERDEAGRILATVLQERTSGGGGGAGRGGGAGAVLGRLVEGCRVRRRGPSPVAGVDRGAFGAVLVRLLDSRVLRPPTARDHSSAGSRMAPPLAGTPAALGVQCGRRSRRARRAAICSIVAFSGCQPRWSSAVRRAPR